MTATHKMVNGKRVDLTAEEAQAIEAQWANKAAEKEAKRNAEAIEKANREAAADKLLAASSLSDEEKALLREKLC